jgi:DNA-binding IclR family transcriptional regulator
MPETDLDDAKGGARYSVPALEKGFEILELLASAPAGLNLTSIAAALGRSTGELYRIIQYLEWRDYIERDAADSYSLSMRLFHLSHEHPPLRSLVAVAVPIMEQFASVAGQSCHLAVLSRTNVTIVAQIDSPLPIRYSVRLGAQFPAWETSSGILLCAMQTEAARRTMFQQLTQLIDDVTMAELLTKMAEVVEHGFEERQSERIPGIVNVSFPVHDRNDQVVAVLTTPYLPQRSNPATIDEVRQLIGTASSRLSEALGHRIARPASSEG